MKVLDLQCVHGHAFEGWFASEDDFVEQKARALLSCPLCGDAQVVKKPSAPRLNLLTSRSTPSTEEPAGTPPALAKTEAIDATEASGAAEQMAAWLEMSRKLAANTTDVGDRFAEEARKIHYGEVAEHPIRGQATAKQTRELVEEGIAVLPLFLPEAAKGRLQ